MRALLSLALLLLTVPCSADIELVGPDEPIDVKEYTQIWVRGISDAHLTAAKVTCEPSAGVMLIPAKSWGGEAFVLFRARNPGAYTLTVSLNAWRLDLDRGIQSAQRAGIDEDLLDELIDVNIRISDMYHLDTGTCRIIVGDDDPPPPPPPTEPIVCVIIIEETGERSAEYALIFTSKKLRAHAENHDYHLFIFDQNTEDRSDKVKSWIAKADGKTLPWAMLANKDGVIVHQAVVPDTTDATIKMIEDHGGLAIRRFNSLQDAVSWNRRQHYGTSP